MVTVAMKLKDTRSLEGKFQQNLDSILKSRDIIAHKGPHSQSYGFSSSHVWMWELERSLRAEEFMLSNCGAGEDAWESPGQQGSQS